MPKRDGQTDEEKAAKMRRWAIGLHQIWFFMESLGVSISSSDEELAAAFDLWFESKSQVASKGA